MSLADLVASPPEQDFIYLGGLKSPGRAYINNVSSPRKWNVPPAYGMAGSPSVTFIGTPPVKFEVAIELWLPSHWLEWQVFSKVLAAPVGRVTPTTGIGILHPLLTTPPLSVTNVVVEDVSQFVQDDLGSHTCTIKFIEWRLGMPGINRATATIPAASKPLPTAQDAIDAGTAARMQTIQDLNK